MEWCLVAEIGPRAQGLAAPDADITLLGIWIARTEDLLRVSPPPPAWQREGYVDPCDVVLQAVELGEALRRLIQGDSTLLDALFSHRNVATSETHEHLLERARDGLHRGHVEHYLARAEAARSADGPGSTAAAAALLLQADHLGRTGQVSTDAAELARSAGRPGLLGSEPGQDDLDALLDQVRRGAASGVLPREYPRPQALDELLLFVREARW